MKTHNILNLYEHLKKASEKLPGQTDEYKAGFQDAIYMLEVALKNFDHINLHYENRKLTKQLEAAGNLTLIATKLNQKLKKIKQEKVVTTT